MNMVRLRTTAVFGIALTVAVLAQEAPVLVRRGEIRFLDPETKRLDVVLDADAVILENAQLRVGICTGAHAGQIMDLLYKPMGLQIANQLVPMGYCRERFNVEGLAAWPKPTNVVVETVEQQTGRAVVRVGYDHLGKAEGAAKPRMGLRSTKTYTLAKGAAHLAVHWEVKNLGEALLAFNPWVAHVGGHLEESLAGMANNRLLQQQGPVNLGHERWADPVTDWTARISAPTNRADLPMVCSLVDFRKAFQYFFWQRSPRFMLQTIYSRISLKPGEVWQTDYVIAAMANLGNVTYASPELAASVEMEGPLVVGQGAALTVYLAPAAELGDVQLKGSIRDAAGKTVQALPDQSVRLDPGGIVQAAYRFTPPADGVYRLVLDLSRDGARFPLGRAVNSQQESITLPLVVGPPPSEIIPKWENDGFAWPHRGTRDVTPWRTLLNQPTLKAGQVRVPDRIFPEDRPVYADRAEPAAIRLAGGEYECLQFFVETPRGADPMTLQASVTPFADGAGATLAAAVLREQIYLTTETPSGFLGFPVGAWPDPLYETNWAERIPDAPITKQNVEIIRACGKRVFWLTVRAETNAPPGRYTGQVRLSLAGKPAGAFPVEVTVSGFALPKRAHFRCSTGMVGWRGSRPSNWEILGLPTNTVKAISDGAMDAYRRLILEYGWTPTMWFSGVKVWDEFKDVGRGPSVFPSNKSKENEAWLIENDLLRYAFIYAPFDEHPDQKVPEVAAWARQWKAESKIPILDCYYGTNVEPLFGLVDVWLGQDPRRRHWGEPVPPLGWGRQAIERKAAGDQFMSCNANLIWHVEFVPVEGRAAFWDDFAAGVDGRYVYSTCRWTDDVYTKNWTSGNYMGCVVYPGPSGISTSIRLETLRDAVEDYDYLAILRDAVVKAEGKATAELIATAKEIVEDPKLADKVKTTDDLHALRDRIADLIEKLITAK